MMDDNKNLDQAAVSLLWKAIPLQLYDKIAVKLLVQTALAIIGPNSRTFRSQSLADTSRTLFGE